MWSIVCEKSWMLHSDNVSNDIFAVNTKLGASIIRTKTYPE